MLEQAAAATGDVAVVVTMLMKLTCGTSSLDGQLSVDVLLQEVRTARYVYTHCRMVSASNYEKVLQANCLRHESFIESLSQQRRSACRSCMSERYIYHAAGLLNIHGAPGDPTCNT